jgi:hypothetical protein
MKYTELEDGDQLVTRTELREVIVAIHEDMLEIKKQISDIRETIRNKWWVPVLVALIAMAANTVVAILVRHL